MRTVRHLPPLQVAVLECTVHSTVLSLRNMRRLLMKMMELEAQRKEEERRGRRNWRTEESHNAGNGKGMFFIWKGTVRCWGTGSGTWSLHQPFRMQSRATMSSIKRKKKKELLPKLHWIMFSTWCKELTHLKRPWCWERLKAGGEGDDRGWDGWMASPTPQTWIW